MTFRPTEARRIALQLSNNQSDAAGLVDSFVQICVFLNEHPESFAKRSSKSQELTLETAQLERLAQQYFNKYRQSNFPRPPHTVPDSAVSMVLAEAFGYTQRDVDRIKQEHQHAMAAENCVGALLERYIDSVLRPHGWSWNCGDFIRAIDFINRDQNGQWLTLQIKNRDNSENSSSSAIRIGTTIQKWFRSFSRTGATNWDGLPDLMRGYNLSKQGFMQFIRTYLQREQQRLQGR
ncbi:MAG: SinI family restriction endonuclease [Candidatus Viridilinea halotolerans]|uniref:SinI family restriction endonuclease n=1 Tax=Candidatus Viridilinea halotolerans TaxID=2491704 RepID=A0A426TWK8_9CHLR|nr:MAG: SinI family restriction endonuclease [Candidatus Viridilinea halotolerans]